MRSSRPCVDLTLPCERVGLNHRKRNEWQRCERRPRARQSPCYVEGACEQTNQPQLRGPPAAQGYLAFQIREQPEIQKKVEERHEQAKPPVPRRGRLVQ